MTIQWGAAVCDATNCFRVGVEFIQSPATVTSATATVTLTARVYLQTKYYADDSSVSWSMTKSFSTSGTASFDHNSGTAWSSANITLLGSKATVFTLQYGTTQSNDTTAAVTGLAAIAGTASVVAEYTIPARPYSAPASPSGLSGTRVDDGQTTLAWTNNPTAGGPYSQLEVERYDYGAASPAYARIATLSGTTSSYTATGQAADGKYAYRIRAKNTAGYSGYVYFGPILTTPDAPTGVTAVKETTDIDVSWTNQARWVDEFVVWHSADGVRDGAPLATVPGGTTSYTHVAPSNSVVHTYEVVAWVDNTPTGNADLSSGYSAASNAVALLAAPNAPSDLAPPPPAGLDATEAAELTWTHNPVDTTAQTAFEVEHRLVGAGTWTTTGKVVSAAQAWTLPAGTYTNGDQFEWRARTWGQYADPSPYSPAEVVDTSARPTATINTPDGITDVATSRVTLEWGFFDDDTATQAAWVASLYDSAANLIESKSGNGAATSVEFATLVADGATYTATVQVQDGNGLWSDESTVTFDVTYAPPPTPVVSLLWDPDAGAVAVTVSVDPPTVGEVDADTVTVWRAIGDGPWVVLAHGIDPNTTVTDYIPALETVNYYRATATSTTPSSSESATVEVVTTGAGGVFVNAGPAFAKIARFTHGVKIGKASGREKVRERYAGRDFSVEYAGEQRVGDFTLTAALFRPDSRPAADSSTWPEVEAVAEQAAPACFRDLEGTRVFVSTGIPHIADVGTSPVRQVSWDFERTDWAEPTEVE